jgi:hypothetical protein
MQHGWLGVGRKIMQCWICGLPAQGICWFCGRAVCKDHTRTMPFVLTAYTRERQVMGLAVDEVLHCGICRPQPQPIELDFLE